MADDSGLRRRFLNEARAASALNHPNIVAIHDICTDQNVDFLVMEHIDGRTLKELIATGVLDFDQLAGLGSQVALALGAAHAAGIVHRDIKPANIMVTPAQEVKVLDFGIAKAAAQRSRHPADKPRPNPRNGCLHVARTDARRGHGLPLGHLLPRLCALRGCRWPNALPGTQRA